MKQTSRIHGLSLMATGALVFLGTNAQLLPAVAFFPAVAVCLLGVVVFMKANREAAGVADERIRRALAPQIRNQTAERHASAQAGIDGRTLASISDTRARRRTTAVPVRSVARSGPEEIELVDVDAAGPQADDEVHFEVTTDVSFPVELQESRSLAEQLQKLQRLCEDGVLTVEEFSIAKAKLLR